MTVHQLPSPSADATLPVADHRHSAAWLGTQLRRRWHICAAIVVLCVITATGAVIPVLALGELVDRVSAHANVQSLIAIAVLAAAAALIGGVAAAATVSTIARLGADLLAVLRETALRAALTLPRPVVEAAGRGDLLSRVSNDVTAINRAVTTVIPTAVTAIALTIVSLIAMAGLDWRLGIAGAVSVPMYILALRWYLPRSAPVYREERRTAGARVQTIVEALGGQRTIAAYSIADERLAAIESVSLRTRDLSTGAFILFTRLVGRVNRAEFVGLGAIVSVGYLLVSAQAISVGAVTAAALLFHRLFNPIGMILYGSAELQLAGAALARLVGMTETSADTSTAEIPAAQAPVAAAPASPAKPSPGIGLSLRDIYFGYHHEARVLAGVNLEIPLGGRLALVGASGSGKSTVAGIADGSLRPWSGSVAVAGSRRVYTVSQEVHVFAGTLIEDLRLAAADADEQQVHRALAQVGADWVDDLPHGVHTMVGEGGHRLSDAQSQQVALARLVLADPDVAILDEATAESGSRYAAELEAAAAAATAGRTTLVIAHRLTQARSADVVAVLADGVLIESGTPDELLCAGGEFSRLWDAYTASQRRPGSS
ncbi:MAG: ABC transporter ATP-binding protein [Gordonia sp. (in: high G+C Gram-positive bacteria)]